MAEENTSHSITTAADRSVPVPVVFSGAVKTRISLVEMLYHARPGQSPTVLETRTYRWLATDEQPYMRQLLIDNHWHFVLGESWIKSPGVLHVKNEEGRYHTYPTDEQRLETESRILEVGIATETRVEPFALVHPGFSHRVDVVEGKQYALRCLTGKAQATVSLFSR